MIADESRGRQEARRRGLPFTGTLGILRAGAEYGLLDLKAAIEHLRKTSFRVSQHVLDQVLSGRR